MNTTESSTSQKLSKRISAKKLAVFLCLMLLAVIGILLVTNLINYQKGWCAAENRSINERELIQKAVSVLASQRYRPESEQRIHRMTKFSNSEHEISQFLKLNPNCCRISREPFNLFSALNGEVIYYVEVVYKTPGQDVSQKDINYWQEIALDSCAKWFDFTFGTTW